MATVIFAKAFRRHVDCPDAAVAGRTVNEVLGAYFEQYPTARSYVLDDGGAVRKHVAVFVDDDQLTDRDQLSDRVDSDGRIHVFQALSGG